jgi:O-antigen ligase
MLLSKKSWIILQVFCVFIVVNCLFFTKLVIDVTLIPRQLLLSLWLLGFLVPIYVLFKNKLIRINFTVLIYFFFVFYSIVSIYWSCNTSLSIVEVAKNVLFFVFFIVCLVLIQKGENQFLSFFSKSILILFFISLIPLLPDFTEFNPKLRYELYSLTSISGHKNLYSSFVYLCLVISFLQLKNFQGHWKKIAFTSILLQLLAIYFLQSRAVYLAVIFFLAAMIFFHFSKNRIPQFKAKVGIQYLIILIVLIFFNFFFIKVIPSFLEAYLQKKPMTYNEESMVDLATLTERVLIWRKTFEMNELNFLFGVGANNWQIYFPSDSLPEIYKVTDLNVTFQRPHNDFLWLLSEYGLFGFNLYYIFVLCVLMKLIFDARDKQRNLILFSGIMGYFIISFFDFPKERIEHNLLFNSILAIAIKGQSNFNLGLRDFNFRISKLSIAITFLALLMTIHIAFLNFKGQYLTKILYNAKLLKKNKQVVQICSEAESYCYNMDPTSLPIKWFKGNAYASLEEYGSALTEFIQARKVHPYNHLLLNDLGSAFFINGMRDSAIYYYKESARINPRFDDPKLNLTAIFINEKKFGEAMKWNESIVHDSERRLQYRLTIENAISEME